MAAFGSALRNLWASEQMCMDFEAWSDDMHRITQRQLEYGRMAMAASDDVLNAIMTLQEAERSPMEFDGMVALAAQNIQAAMYSAAAHDIHGQPCLNQPRWSMDMNAGLPTCPASEWQEWQEWQQCQQLGQRGGESGSSRDNQDTNWNVN